MNPNPDIAGGAAGGAADDTESLLDALDRHRNRTGSVEIFDALVARNPGAVQLALSRAPAHPLRDAVSAWLRARDVAPPELPSAEEVRVQALEERIAILERRFVELNRNVDAIAGLGQGTLKVADAYAAICVVLFGIAVLGWAAAFGILPFTPESPVQVQPEKSSAPRSTKE